MNRTVADIIAKLDAFVASGNECEDVDRLDAVVDGLRSMPGARTALPALFDLLERHPQSDLGAPGPIVHEIEAIGGHVSELLASIRRFPVDLTVWMVNRLLNSDLEPPIREELLDALRDVATNKAVIEQVRESARQFLEYQGKSS